MKSSIVFVAALALAGSSWAQTAPTGQQAPATPAAAGPAAAAPTAATPVVKVGPEVCSTGDNRAFVEPGPPLPGMGKIVFFRASRLQAAAVSFRVRAGELDYCTLSNGTYFVVDLAPGSYRFDTRGEVRDYLTLEVEAGETYYVEGRLGMALVTMRPNISPSSKAEFDKIKTRLKMSRH